MMRRAGTSFGTRRLAAVWSALVVLTLGSFAFAHDRAHGSLGFVAVVLIAGIKARLIVREFMEIRCAPLVWKLVFDGLVLMAVVMLLLMHLLAEP